MYYNVTNKFGWLGVVLFFLIFSQYSNSAPSLDYNIKLLPIAESLPNTTVKRFFQDTNGYLWFGTESGLCRYDGYKTKIIKSTIDYPNRLTSNYILSFAEDKQQRIWVGTQKGINIIDVNGMPIKLFENNVILERRINSLRCTADGDMWIGTEEGLYRYNATSTSLMKYSSKINDPHSLSGKNINFVFQDSKSTIWIALWDGGLCQYNSKTDNFNRMPFIGKKNNPFCLYEDKNHRIWIGTWGDGLVQLLNPNAIKCDYKYFNYNNEASGGNSQISSNVVYGIVQDDVIGHLWMVTHEGLRVLVDPANGVFEKISTHNVYGSSSNFLHSIYKDRQGNIWVGATNDGVYWINVNKSFFGYNLIPQVKQKYGYSVVNAITEINGKAWFGFTKGGFVVVDSNNLTNSNFKLEYENNLNRATVKSICQSTVDGSIWVAGDELWRFVPKGKGYQKVPITCISKKNKFVANCFLQQTNALMSDKKGRMWIGQQDALLLWYPTGIIEQIAEGFTDITYILAESETVIWVASASKGLLRITEQKNNHKFFIEQLNVKNGKLNCSNINSMLLDSKGRLWLSSNEGGLQLYDKQQNKFFSVNKEYALLDDAVSNILEDDNGFLWLSTQNKIIKLDTKTKLSVLFSANENIKVKTFRNAAAAKMNGNKLFFGGSEGICFFTANKTVERRSSHKVLITDIELFNKSIFDLSQSEIVEFENNTLTLTYKQQNVGIEFSSLNYSMSDNVRYAYKLDGFDPNWIYVDGKRRFVNYNNLKAGTYTFKVKATNENGVWNENAKDLKIIVQPAPYLTWWAKLNYFIILTTLGFFIFKTIKNRLALKHALLISNIEKQKNEELTQTKLRYFTNVSHELLTPLTIISCLIDESKLHGSALDHSKMKANINRLKRLLQQILDFRKTESANMKLKVGQSDLVKYIQDICKLNFEPLSHEKNIQFTIDSASVSIIAWFDQDKIDKIIYNLLSNAFKYTPIGGAIDLQIEEIEINETPSVRILVHDNGKGIAPDFLKIIFNRFVSDSHDKDMEANGIGLSLVKDLIELHKGTVKVNSKLNEGSTFTIEFPIDYQSYLYENKFENTNPECTPSEIIEHKAELIANTAIEKPSIPILVVEDNADLIEIIVRQLSSKYIVYKANNGLEALKLITDNDISVVVSDVMMPEMDGWELCKTIKQSVESAHIPVVLLTAKSQIEDRITSYNAGADAYITKPFDMAILEARIDNLIKNRLLKNKEYTSNLNVNIQQLEYSSVDQEFLKKAIAIVEAELANFDFRQDDLVARMNTTKSTLWRKLKSLTGVSANEFIRNIRLKHACLMLQDGVGNISDIAYMVGFNDPKYFSTCFRVEFGCTPREYIKKNAQ